MAVQVVEQTILRDPALFYWILIPISVVMILTGILRHYATSRERHALLRGVNLRNHAAAVLDREAFEQRKTYLVNGFRNGSFLKDPENQGQPPANPMTDPAGMEAMMGMLKGNMMMMIPQTLIMSWINAFFSGFVILKLPFPLTIRFKSMLQSGVMTRDLDVRWVSSLSWYFLNLMGLQSVFGFILGSDNAANQMAQQVGMANPAAMMNPMQPGQDPDKLFKSEAENLEVMEHFCILDGVEENPAELCSRGEIIDYLCDIKLVLLYGI
ncbi:ER membrane protein complex subunit 3 [Penicillium chermesinum]|uniref:ER membrane protein complex subunit 3 n=1 Tax=Penicillium chermesinum TaxID=63820 RepID=A0A9W9P081_9EURO|nr:ER membrane protein complex subunit 3 [Penicillium chermesinum]KAJ5232967.1 ER membrane protein complex subunit 3 [Penicillium chermesinum]